MAVNTYVMGLLGRFNTPNRANVEQLIRQLRRTAGRPCFMELAELHVGAGRTAADGRDDFPT